MKVLLVNPSFPGNFHVTPPLGLGYVGTALREAGHIVKLVDLGRDPKQYLEEILGAYTPECVGITGMSTQYPGMKQIAGLAKSKGVTTVVGGIHVSAIPEFVLEDCGDSDFAVKGEGERTFPELLWNLERGNSYKGIPGLYYRSSGHIVGELPAPIQDLDSLASPWNILDPWMYSSSRVHGLSARKGPAVSVISSRGCPYGCVFCSASQVHGKVIRLRSPENFLDELDYLISVGVREVQVLDDNFTFYREHAYAISQGIIDRGLQIFWTLPNGIRADKVDKELLEKMWIAGCYYVGFGIESGSERLLKIIRKALSLETVDHTIREANRIGFTTQGFFMVGHPEETVEDRAKTLKVAKSLPLDRISVSPMMPLPGSELYNYYVSQGLLDPKTVDWTSFNRYLFSPFIGVSLTRFIKKLHREFYLNPTRIWRNLSKVRSLSQVRGLLLGLYLVLRAVIRGKV